MILSWREWVIRLQIAGPFYAVINLLVGLCVCAISAAVVWSFTTASADPTVEREQRSPVDTFTMVLFFLLFYAMIRFRLGTLPRPAAPGDRILALAGLLLVVLGTVVNILGRRDLGRNWGNRIRIYRHHTLVTRGTFAWVRHPLYASIIWMFFGAGLIYRNPASLAALLLIFLPFMSWRARQEERLLAARFPEYANYRRRTGMFFPRLHVRRQP
jgi:protein-S-isoprenylcysteine O-methyltransferase Ste14